MTIYNVSGILTLNCLFYYYLQIIREKHFPPLQLFLNGEL